MVTSKKLMKYKIILIRFSFEKKNQDKSTILGIWRVALSAGVWRHGTTTEDANIGRTSPVAHFGISSVEIDAGLLASTRIIRLSNCPLGYIHWRAILPAELPWCPANVRGGHPETNTICISGQKDEKIKKSVPILPSMFRFLICSATCRT
jgi:hypothetical protein